VDTSKEGFSEKYNYFVKGYISSVAAIRGFEVVNPFSKVDVTGYEKCIRILNRNGVAFVEFIDKIIAIPYNKTLDKSTIGVRFEVDYLVVNRYSPKRVLNFFKPKVVIVDSSVSKYELAKAADECKQQNIPFYITSSQGAYILNCPSI